MATVLLPGSLLALFPGVGKRHEVTGTTVAEVLNELDARVPGMRDRLVEPGRGCAGTSTSSSMGCPAT